MEDDVGPVLAEDPLHRLLVPDVGEYDRVALEQPVSLQVELHPLQGGLVPVEHDQPGRLEPRDLAAQLAADASTGAGDEHGAAGELTGDRGLVEGDRSAAQEVLEVDVADVSGGGVLPEQLAHGGQHHRREACLAGPVVQLAHGLGVGLADRDNHPLRVGGGRDPAQVSAAPADPHALDGGAVRRAVVVQESDRAVCRGRVLPQRADQRAAAAAGAIHQHPLLALGPVVLAAAGGAHDEAGGHHQQHGQEHGDDGHGARQHGGGTSRVQASSPAPVMTAVVVTSSTSSKEPRVCPLR